MISIDEYILLSRDERRAHLELNTVCDERGGNSKEFRGLLAHHLNTSIPKGHQAYLCHACHNGKCSNVKHLYWGTPTDNVIDANEDSGMNINDRVRQKYSSAEVIALKAKGGFASANKPRKKLDQSIIEERFKIFNSIDKTAVNWESVCAKQMNLTLRQFKRFIRIYGWFTQW